MNKTGLRKLNDVTKKYKELLLKDIESKKILLETVEECICCKNKTFEKLLDVDRFDLPFGSYICKSCGLVTTSPRIKQESLPYYYDKYYHPLNYGKENLDNQTALFKKGQGEKIFDTLYPYIQNKSNLKILEVGAGVGNVLEEFKDKAVDNSINIELYGTEYSHDCIVQCMRKGLNMIEGNAQSVLNLNQKFDIIILSHVFEHFIDLENELSILKKLLKKNGLLYIEVPGILTIHDKPYYNFSFLGYSVHAHMYNFSSITLQNIVNKYGFIQVESNETVEAIFKLENNSQTELVNDTLRIRHYLEFLESTQSFALTQNQIVESVKKKEQDIIKYQEQVKNRDKDIVKYQEQVKNRDKDIVKYQEQVKNRDKDIVKYQEQVKNRNKLLSDIKSLINSFEANSIISLFKNKKILIEIKKLLG